MVECQNCKHWEESSEESWGHCHKITNTGFVSIDNATDFRTRFNFGCALGEEDEVLEMARYAAQAAEKIRAIHRNPKQPWLNLVRNGRCQCPKCNAMMEYTIAENEHTSGKCTTEGCLEWKE